MKSKLCYAGRRCGFSGKWHSPCPNNFIHAIANPGGSPILLCDQHFQEVAAAGLVTDQNIGEDEFERREKERNEKPVIEEKGPIK